MHTLHTHAQPFGDQQNAALNYAVSKVMKQHMEEVSLGVVMTGRPPTDGYNGTPS